MCCNERSVALLFLQRRALTFYFNAIVLAFDDLCCRNRNENSEYKSSHFRYILRVHFHLFGIVDVDARAFLHALFLCSHVQMTRAVHQLQSLYLRCAR